MKIGCVLNEKHATTTGSLSLWSALMLLQTAWNNVSTTSKTCAGLYMCMTCACACACTPAINNRQHTHGPTCTCPCTACSCVHHAFCSLIHSVPCTQRTIDDTCISKLICCDVSSTHDTTDGDRRCSQCSGACTCLAVNTVTVYTPRPE